MVKQMDVAMQTFAAALTSKEHNAEQQVRNWKF